MVFPCGGSGPAPAASTASSQIYGLWHRVCVIGVLAGFIARSVVYLRG